MKRKAKKGSIISISISPEKGTAKTAVDSCIIETDFGIKGDAHAGSEAQVTILPESSLKKYERLTGMKIVAGECSENMVVSGLDTECCPPGTEIRVGKDVVMEVIRIGKDVRDECPAYGRLRVCPVAEEGLFLKVLNGGDVCVGDKVEVTYRDGGTMYRYAIITCSDKGSVGERQDLSAVEIEALVAKNLEYKKEYYSVIPDEKEVLLRTLRHCVEDLKVDLVLTTGGTGLSERDITPEVTAEYIDRPVPGLAEFMRSQSAKVTNNGILSRGVTGIKEKTLIINLPGSPKGAAENLGFIMDAIPHALGIMTGNEKECGQKR